MIQKEIRSVKGQPYTVEVDYSNDPNGKIVGIIRRVKQPIKLTEDDSFNFNVTNIKDLKLDLNSGTKPKLNYSVATATAPLTLPINPVNISANNHNNNKGDEEDMDEALVAARVQEAISKMRYEESLQKSLSDTGKGINYIRSDIETLKEEMSRLKKDNEGYQKAAEGYQKTAKLAQAVETARALKGSSLYDEPKIPKIIPPVVDCPTCHTHTLKRISPLEVKCEGPNCGSEFLLVDKKFDAKCSTCGLPLRQKTAPDKCPRCGSTKATRL